MKTNDTKPTAKMYVSKTIEKTPCLSDKAFYLIALALLLKEETGQASLKHYLQPGGNREYPNKMIA